jgi:tetrahydromethanopterin S-methyltransferase subunit B
MTEKTLAELQEDDLNLDMREMSEEDMKKIKQLVEELKKGSNGGR